MPVYPCLIWNLPKGLRKRMGQVILSLFWSYHYEFNKVVKWERKKKKDSLMMIAPNLSLTDMLVWTGSRNSSIQWLNNAWSTLADKLSGFGRLFTWGSLVWSLSKGNSPWTLSYSWYFIVFYTNYCHSSRHAIWSFPRMWILQILRPFPHKRGNTKCSRSDHDLMVQILYSWQ